MHVGENMIQQRVMGVINYSKLELGAFHTGQVPELLLSLVEENDTQYG